MHTARSVVSRSGAAQAGASSSSASVLTSRRASSPSSWSRHPPPAGSSHITTDPFSSSSTWRTGTKTTNQRRYYRSPSPSSAVAVPAVAAASPLPPSSGRAVRPAGAPPTPTLSCCSSSASSPPPISAEMAISNFHVTFDASSSRFKPGDELSGKVVMDVWATVDIKHVEFHIHGKGTLRMFHSSSTFIERPKHELYLDKKIILIGSSNSHRGVTLEPGRYVTDFKYTLPDSVPPSVHQFDMGNGYVFDISYAVQARVCDFVHSRRKAAHPGAAKMLRVIKATRKGFSVIPLQDWHTISRWMDPVAHSDQLLLFCGKRDPTTVIVTMDRGIYPVGDNIRVSTEVISPDKDVIKDISAELEQQLFFDTDIIKKFRRVILKAFDDGRNRKVTKNGTVIKSSFGISLPTNIVPSYLPNCKMIDLEYTMKVKVRFQKCRGKLVIRLPVVIAPASDADRKEEGDLPLFNKPVMQFPYFSKSPYGNGQSTSGGSNSASDESGTLSRSIKRQETTAENVTTKYKTGLNCCGCCLLCLGFGIVDS